MWSNVNNCGILTNENEVNMVPDPVTQPGWPSERADIEKN